VPVRSVRFVSLVPFLALTLITAGCASSSTTPVPLPNVTGAAFPEFVQPTIPESFGRYPAAVASVNRGWRFLEAGDLGNAEREFRAAVRSSMDFYPAETALGYLELARKEPKGALSHFEKALSGDPRYVSALVGGGQAFLALGRETDALFAFQSAVAVNPSLSDVKRRVEVLQFRGLGQDLSTAREAAKAGKFDDAARAYANAIKSSPDSAFLYRELAGVEAQRGATDAALADLRKALAIDPADVGSIVQVGDLLAARGDVDGAERSYAEALALEHSNAVEAKLDALHAKAEIARLPAEYGAIGAAAEITRGELAALIGVRLPEIVQAARRPDGVVITDVQTHWAATWIIAVARAGVMDPFDNHAFQPNAVVRRADLAVAMSRLLTRLATQDPVRGRAWTAARVKFTDLAVTHLAYPAASMSVAAGVMSTAADNRFQPGDVVTGADAVQAVARIAALSSASATGGGAGSVGGR
jgi:tetratricopeptide (TPR) repeat protein